VAKQLCEAGRGERGTPPALGRIGRNAGHRERNLRKRGARHLIGQGPGGRWHQGCQLFVDGPHQGRPNGHEARHHEGRDANLRWETQRLQESLVRQLHAQSTSGTEQQSDLAGALEQRSERPQAEAELTEDGTEDFPSEGLRGYR
jgi:hypothetical protein